MKKKIFQLIKGDDWDVLVGYVLIALMIAVLCVFFTMGTASLVNAFFKK
jgi:hypothetical protein